jgi:hypothetical protein
VSLDSNKNRSLYFYFHQFTKKPKEGQIEVLVPAVFCESEILDTMRHISLLGQPRMLYEFFWFWFWSTVHIHTKQTQIIKQDNVIQCAWSWCVLKELCFHLYDIYVRLHKYINSIFMGLLSSFNSWQIYVPFYGLSYTANEWKPLKRMNII